MSGAAVVAPALKAATCCQKDAENRCAQSSIAQMNECGVTVNEVDTAPFAEKAKSAWAQLGQPPKLFGENLGILVAISSVAHESQLDPTLQA